MERSWVTRALPRAIVAGGLLILSATATARAAEAPGSIALKQARIAWDRGSFATAETLYREALEQGGLAPDEVLEGYVRLASVRASLGKKDQAIAAFRAASILDADFSVPPQAGPKGPAYAAQARRDTAKIGPIKLSLEAPKEVAAGRPFHVRARLDAGHVPIVAKVALLVRDGTSGKETAQDVAPTEEVEFEVPGQAVLPNASLLLRVDALDKRANRLASAEERVRVPEGATAAAASPALATTTTYPAEAPQKRGGFWSSPWPYLIGGVALAGAGAAVYFGTRPPEDVSVGAVGVRTR